jgi:hypothetical protein
MAAPGGGGAYSYVTTTARASWISSLAKVINAKPFTIEQFLPDDILAIGEARTN